MLRLESIVRDLRHACRSLARRPGFAAVAVITVAVGIGTMTVAFAPEAPIPQRIDRLDGRAVRWRPDDRLRRWRGTAAARRATRLAIATAIAPPTIIGGGRSGRLRVGIVSIQVAGATPLLTLAGLLVRSAITTAAAPLGYVYLPFEPADYGNAVAVVLRTAGDPEPLTRTLSNQIRALDPALPVVQLRTMQARIAAREQSGNLIVVKFLRYLRRARALPVSGRSGRHGGVFGRTTRTGVRRPRSVGARPAIRHVCCLAAR